MPELIRMVVVKNGREWPGCQMLDPGTRIAQALPFNLPVPAKQVKPGGMMSLKGWALDEPPGRPAG